MLRFIDDILNRTTMYRLVLYELLVLVAVAAVLGGANLIPVNPAMLLFSSLFIFLVCWVTNRFFAFAFDAQTNAESYFITALILVLIISPPLSFGDVRYLEIAFWASVWSMASKYLVAIGRKHIFNPAAFGVAITAIVIQSSASWWVSTLPMLPFVFLGGILIMRKILRFDLVIAFLIAALAMLVFSFHPDVNATVLFVWKTLANTPLLFFATVMLTEPLTTPPTRGRRIVYGALTGLLFAPWIHVGPVFLTPELTLLLGNLFSYILSPKEKLLLTLEKRIPIGADIEDFIFSGDRKISFTPGQYLEWTLGHKKTDTRGNRRYFTISSSPGEEHISIGVRNSDRPSSFKKKLFSMQPGDMIIASQLAGDFVLPKDANEKLAFIAGGIGITPFRSMVRNLLDRHESKDIILIYSNRTEEDIAYKEVFDEAERALKMHVMYTLTDSAVREGWKGKVGRVNAEMIKKEIPDFRERRFYLSGTHTMVASLHEELLRLSISERRIVKDYFPGFA